jgi:plasmid stabilization system protein ParE
MKVRYRRLALLDIENIHDYLGKRNPRAAIEAIARIRDAIDGLRVWPHKGHVGRVRGTYEWTVVGSPYVVVYEVDRTADEVAIIGIFHGTQDRDRSKR